MNTKNETTVFFLRYLHLFLLGLAGSISSLALLVIHRFDATRLNSFGPTAKLYFAGLKNGLTISTAILLFSFFVALFFQKQIQRTFERLTAQYGTSSESKKNIFILILCIVFAFASHFGDVVNGYFNQDDFMVIAVNRTVAFPHSIFIPHGNDHMMPIFMAEIGGLDALFRQNPIPYNLFFFTLFALIPFFIFLSFKKLGIGIQGFLVFLIIFTGATGWATMMPGFYIMTVYPQTIFFFSIALFSYLSWQENKEKKYLFVFAISMISALLIDIAGIWVIPVMIIMMMYQHWSRYDSFGIKMRNIREFFIENKKPLVVFFGVLIAFILCFIYVFFVIQPNSFLSVLDGGNGGIAPDKTSSWKLIPLTKNFLSLFASGVSLSLFIPKIQVILSHPAVKNTAEIYWPFIEMIILFVNVFVFWFAIKYAKVKEKKMILALSGIMFVGIIMVIVARPDYSIIPNFDYRYAGTAFFAYCFFLALGASIFFQTKKELATRIIVPIVIIIFSAQQAFGLESLRTQEESKMRKIAVEQLNKTLISELDAISKEKKDGNLVVPNLSGVRIFEKTMAGFPLSYYVLFFNRKTPMTLVQSPEIQQDGYTKTVVSVSNLRASTSPEFVTALKKSEVLRQYYFSSAIMSRKIITENSSSTIISNKEKEILFRRKEIDPKLAHTAGFILSTDDIEGNLELSFTFKNDFDWKEPAGKIKIDDFTPYEIKNGKRIYRVETDLLQLYSYALSEKISNLILFVPNTKNASVSGIVFK